MIKYSVGSIITSILLTFILVLIFKKMGATVAIGAAGLTGWLLTYWFARTEKRVPSKNERILIVSIYGVCIAALIFMSALMAPNVSGGGIITMVILAVAYPGFLSIIFTEKYVSKYIKPSQEVLIEQNDIKD